MTSATAQSPVTDPEQQAAAARLSQPSSQWSDQLGQAAIRCSGHSIDSLSGEAELLLPLIEQPQELLFTQWGVHRKQQTTTLNAGIGYRWFDKSQGYWGTNLFYDRQFHNAYSRWGIGIEQYYRNSRIALNSYFPIQTQLTTLNKTTAYAAPALGIDLRCQYQIPTLPHWRVNLQAERYWGDIIVSKGKTVENHTAMTLGLDYTPIPLITAGYGFRYDNAQQKSHQLHLQLNYRFGVPASQQLHPQQVANQLFNLERLALVQRNPQIVLKQIVPKQIVPKQKPNAVMKLELPSQIVGAPGTTQIISFKLTTPHPHDQWRWAYSTSKIFIDSRIELLSDNKISITLPRFPGHHTIQLVATNQRGVSVTSNRMSIHVKDSYAGSAHANTDHTKSPDFPWSSHANTDHTRSPDFPWSSHANTDHTRSPDFPWSAHANTDHTRSPDFPWSAHANTDHTRPSDFPWSATSKPDQRMCDIFRSQEEIKTLENACEIFKVPCSAETLKNEKTYRKKYYDLSKVYHSDKGGEKDDEKMKIINNIRSTLDGYKDRYLANK